MHKHYVLFKDLYSINNLYWYYMPEYKGSLNCTWITNLYRTDGIGFKSSRKAGFIFETC